MAIGFIPAHIMPGIPMLLAKPAWRAVKMIRCKTNGEQKNDQKKPLQSPQARPESKKERKGGRKGKSVQAIDGMSKGRQNALSAIVHDHFISLAV